MRRAAMALAPAALALFGACAKKDPSVALSVLLPADVAASAQWIEIGVFDGGACPGAGELAGGLPVTGTVARLAFRASDASPPPLGDLPKGSYAFAAVARDGNCAVVGVGCADVDVTDARDVAIDVSSAMNAATACGAGQTCEDARCAPITNTGDPSDGAGCSMVLVGAGPLADPLTPSGTIVSAPAIAATGSGFVVAYREYDPSAGDARLTLLPIDLGGAEGAPQQTMLDGRCAAQIESDATALAFADPMNGLVALARAPCSGVGGIDLFEVDATGTIGTASFNAVGSDTLTLSTSHALAASADGSSYLLAFVDGATAHVAPVTGTSVQATSNAAAFGGDAPEANGWVAEGAGALALVAVGAGGGDAGGSTARVQVAAASASLSSLPAPFDYTASWASVATEGARAFVVNDDESTGTPLAWSTFDVGSAAPTSTGGVTLASTVIYADVALHGDYAVFAVEEPGTIALVTYAHATTTPAFQAEIDFASDPRIPATPGLRDGRLSIAASDTRVAVAWATGEMLGDSDGVGGYAVFACSP